MREAEDTKRILYVLGENLPVLAILIEPHATGVVGDRGGPVGEDPLDAHLLGEHVERDHDIAIAFERGQGRLVVVKEGGPNQTISQILNRFFIKSK